jgi:ABC-type Zn uptake system ZnuABC Zn-binding protein ZnuA
MLSRRHAVMTLTGFLAWAATAWPSLAEGQPDKVKVVATFSILGDLVRQVGGDRVELVTLVGPDGDAHVYAPTPADSRRLAGAALVVANGLGFEGWISRLIRSSGTRARLVEATQGIRPLAIGGKAVDPHAWQDVANLIGKKQPGPYATAVTLLKDLREIHDRAGTPGEFARRLHDLREQHRGKSSLMRRLTDAGLTSR